MFTEVCRRLDQLHAEIENLHTQVKHIKKQQQQILDLLKVNEVHEMLKNMSGHNNRALVSVLSTLSCSSIPSVQTP